MTTATQARRGAALTDGLARVWEDLWLARARRRSIAQTHDALARLSDRELDDIGLTRGQIGAVARRSVLGY